MNAKQRKQLEARRICACIGFVHCCETIHDFKARMRKEANNARIH